MLIQTVFLIIVRIVLGLLKVSTQIGSSSNSVDHMLMLRKRVEGVVEQDDRERSLRAATPATRRGDGCATGWGVVKQSKACLNGGLKHKERLIFGLTCSRGSDSGLVLNNLELRTQRKVEVFRSIEGHAGDLTGGVKAAMPRYEIVLQMNMVGWKSSAQK